MSFQIAYTYEIIDKFSAPLARIEQSIKKVERKLKKFTDHTRTSIQVLTKFGGIINKQRADLDKYGMSLKKASQNAKQLNHQLRGAPKKALGPVSAITKKGLLPPPGSVKALSRFGKLIRGQRKDIDKYGLALGRASVSAKRLTSNLKGIPKKFPKVPARAATGGLPGLPGTKADPLEGLNKSFDRAKSKAAGLRGQLMDTAATFALFALPIRQAIKFESAMADVKKVLNDITPAQLITLEKVIKDLGISTGLGARGIADIVAAGGRLGIKPGDLPDFTLMVAKASVAFDILPEIAGDALASISNKMKIPIKDMGLVADAINHLSDTTAAKAPNMIEIMGRLAGTMSLLKMPPEIAAGFAAFADQVEVSAQLGASGLNMMINRMQKVPALQKKLLENPKQAIVDMLAGLKKLDAVSQFNVIQKIFGDEAGRFVQKAVSNFDLLESTLGKVADKTKFAGSMTREFEVRMATTEGGLKRMTSSLGVAAANIGVGLLPAINSIAESLVSVTSGIASFAEQFPMLTTFIMGTIVSLIAFRLAFLAGSFIVTQFKLIMIGARIALVMFKTSALATAVIPAIFATIRAAALAMSITLSAAGAGANILKFALKGLLAASGIGLLVLAVTAIMENWDAIVESVKEAASWISGIFGSSDVDITQTQEQKITAITEEAKAKAQKGTLNGQITVSALPGSEVVSAEAESTGMADLGFNMRSL